MIPTPAGILRRIAEEMEQLMGNNQQAHMLVAAIITQASNLDPSKPVPKELEIEVSVEILNLISAGGFSLQITNKETSLGVTVIREGGTGN